MDFLMCDEAFSTPSPSSHSTDEVTSSIQVDTAISTLANPTIDEDEYDNAMKHYLNREKNFKPLNGYMEKLKTSIDLSNARFKAVDWIIKARINLSLPYGIAFAAVNYVDRFLSMHLHINTWEMWMGELIAIACLSIACKVDDDSAPKLHLFQTVDQEHAYEPTTIRSMELRILKALDYRLICVTSYTYLDILIQKINASHCSTLMDYIMELLLRGLLEDKLVSCSAIAIAVAIVQCSVEKVIPFEFVAQYYYTLEQLLPSEHKEEKEMCWSLMKVHIVSPLFSPVDGTIMLGKRKENLYYISVDIDRCFPCSNECREVSAWKKRRST